MSIGVPQGFRMAGVHCGLKRDPEQLDFSLVVSDVPAVAAGVYTQNLVYAAPVALDRSRTPSDRIRAVAVNSRNANACTGLQGLRDAEEMARLAATACGADGEQALVMSTGVIGVFLPLDKIARGVELATPRLGSDETALMSAARGMMTTDTIPKLAGRELSLGGRTIRITGLAKGAAMMGPNMATMLALILTDAPLDKQDAQASLFEAVNDTFNCISVEGHTSTNDTVLLVANGQSGGRPLVGQDLAQFRQALHDVCEELARLIPFDGEGA
jgi:glutamate N-acetyltransferase / amino-acid N-acetyltransferase